MSYLPEPKDDSLYIPTVGEWSKDKHHFLMRYIDAFTEAMKKKNWKGLHYIDLFAGAGLECLEESKKLEWGSPLIAAQSPNPFDALHLCELSKRKYNALKIRIEKYAIPSQLLQGDANEKIQEIINEIPTETLSLAFLDPYGLHLDYDTLSILSNIRADLIIFFPDHLDALRNWELNYFDNPNSNLDRCLGTGADWRNLLNEALPEKRAEVLRNLYEKQIGKLGYTEFDNERIYMKGHPLYRLIFCSRHKIATKIWRGTSRKKPNGSSELPFKE